MLRIYTPEEIGKILQNLPEELKEAFFSLDTAEVIHNTCKTYGITDEKVGKVSDCVGQILMGLLPLSEFPKAVKEETNLPDVLVRAVTQEINRFILYPVRPVLEQLYKMEITPSEEKKETPSRVLPKEEKIREAISFKGGTTVIEKEKPEEPEEPAGEDVYREPIE